MLVTDFPNFKNYMIFEGSFQLSGKLALFIVIGANALGNIKANNCSKCIIVAIPVGSTKSSTIRTKSIRQQ